MRTSISPVWSAGPRWAAVSARNSTFVGVTQHGRGDGAAVVGIEAGVLAGRLVQDAEARQAAVDAADELAAVLDPLRIPVGTGGGVGSGVGVGSGAVVAARMAQRRSLARLAPPVAQRRTGPRWPQRMEQRRSVPRWRQRWGLRMATRPGRTRRQWTACLPAIPRRLGRGLSSCRYLLWGRAAGRGPGSSFRIGRGPWSVPPGSVVAPRVHVPATADRRRPAVAHVSGCGREPVRPGRHPRVSRGPCRRDW